MSDVVKNDLREGQQSYLCKSCGKQFIEKRRINKQLLWHDYIFGKQTLKQLSNKYRVSVSSVQRCLQGVRSTRVISSDKQVVVLMDTTYWGRGFGVMVFKDALGKKIVWRKFVKKEGIDRLLANGFKIQVIHTEKHPKF